MRDIADKIIVKESCELLKAETFPAWGQRLEARVGLKMGKDGWGNAGSPWLTAQGVDESSVLKLPGTAFCQQPE